MVSIRRGAGRFALAVWILCVCAGSAFANAQEVVTPPLSPADGDTAAPSPQPGFFSRLFDFYKNDWTPPPPNPNPPPASPAPQRRTLPSPLDSPPFPSSDWSYGGSPDIGAPDSNTYPLMSAIDGAKAHSKLYGWLEPGLNFSTSSQSNLPIGYDLYPNRIELDQLVLYAERLPDTVQTAHFDWGYHLTAWFGTDYRFTTQKGILAGQLLKHNRQYGFDVPSEYVDLYFPHVAQGMNIRAGRIFNVPGIESVPAPSNFMFSHSLVSIYSPFTVTGVIDTIKLSPQWLVQGGITGGGDIAPWADGAKPSAVACLNYTTRSANDNVYACANGINNGKYAYDNVQQYDLTWYRKWSKTVNTATEAWYMYQRDVPSTLGPIAPLSGTNGASCLPGEIRCTAPEYAAVNYINKEFSSKLYLSFRTEFFDDNKGQRTGYTTRYSENTIALDKWIGSTVQVRPELRWDHSYDAAAFNLGRNHSQLTFASDAIFHF